MSSQGLRVSFTRSIMAVTSRQAGVLVLLAVAGLVVARGSDPATFALYAMALYVSGFLNALGDAGFALALIRRSAPPTADELRDVITWNGLAALVVAVLGIALSDPVAGLVGGGDEARWLVVWLALAVLWSPLQTAPTVRLERDLRYGPIAIGGLAEATTFSLVAIGATSLHSTAAWFGFAVFLQNGVGAVVLNLLSPGVPRPRVALSSTLRQLLAHGARLQGSAILSLGKDVLRPLMGSGTYGARVAGLVEWSQSYVNFPLLAASAAQRVLLPTLSTRVLDPGAQRRLAGRLSRGLGYAVAPLLAVAAAGFDVLVPSVFGDQWLASKSIALALVAFSLLGVLAGPYLVLWNAWGRTRYTLAVTALWSILPLAGIGGLGSRLSVRGYFIGLGAAQIVTVSMMYRARQSVGALVRDALPTVVGSTATIATFALLRDPLADVFVTSFQLAIVQACSSAAVGYAIPIAVMPGLRRDVAAAGSSMMGRRAAS